MSDLFGDVPEKSPREITEKDGCLIWLAYSFLSYVINYIILITVLVNEPIASKKVLFLFSPVILPVEIFIFSVEKVLKLLDYIF